MVWKNAENGFHGVELFWKVASMAWKNGEFDFHGMEDLAERRLMENGGQEMKFSSTWMMARRECRQDAETQTAEGAK